MTTIAGHHVDWIQSLYQKAMEEVIQSPDEGNILFSQFGDFTDKKIENTLKLAEAAVLETGQKRQTMKRFTSLLLEILQNISLHGASDGAGHMHAFLIISHHHGKYRVDSGNMVLSEEINQLRHRLDELNNMDKNALRRLYIETLCNDEFSFKGGAGLGLLTVAKRAEGKLSYSLHELNTQLCYFQMHMHMASI